jgi:mRNA interferase MazF
MVKKSSRFDVFLVPLDPTIGSEIKKTRPCVVISPDEINQYLRTVIVAPLTSATRDYDYRINLVFQGKSGQIALDQIRTIDKTRLVKKLGSLSNTTARTISDRLVEMFVY